MTTDVRRCRTPGVDPDLWFSGDASIETVYARTLCNACPLKTACRDYARTEGIPDGVWGGETGPEREFWWEDHGGRPEHFREVIDTATLALLQERRDFENWDTQHTDWRAS